MLNESTYIDNVVQSMEFQAQCEMRIEATDIKPYPPVSSSLICPVFLDQPDNT